MTKRLWGLVLLVALVVGGFPPPTAAQTPGVWEELTGTRFDQSPAICGKPGAPAPPLCVPTLLPNGGNNQLGSIFGAWNGAAFDTSRRQLVLARTGGHADWAGNQVVAFTLPTATTPGAWRSLRGPSLAYPPTSQPSVCPYSDGTPCSVHTYDAMAYLPDQDVIWTGGGRNWWIGNWERQTWLFSLTDSSWTRKADRPSSSSDGMASIWDPVAHRLLYRDQSALRSYDPATDLITVLVNLSGAVDSFASEMSTAALDVEGRKFYRLRRKQSASTPGTALRMIDLANPSLGERVLTATGDLEVETLEGIGLMHHAGGLVALGKTANGLNSALYRLDPAGCGLASQPVCQWTRYTPPSGALPPLGNSHGVLKKFFVDTDGQTFYFVPGYSANVWRMKSPWATPPPVYRTLTITTAGAGTGTTTGQGPYLQGTAATPTMTPNPGSASGGFSAPCNTTPVLMDADKSCVATFTLLDTQAPVVSIDNLVANQLVSGTITIATSCTDNVGCTGTTLTLTGPAGVIPVTGPVDTTALQNGIYTVRLVGQDAAGNTAEASVQIAVVNCQVCQGWLAPNTWLPSAPPVGQPYTLAGKHRRSVFLAKRQAILVAGGDADGSDAGNARVYEVDARTLKGTLRSPMCLPAPTLMPNFPDNAAWVYDSKRDEALLLRGFFFELARGAALCGRSDPNIQRADMVFRLSDHTWQPAPWPLSELGLGGDINGPTWGVYDEPTDSVYLYRWDGSWGCNFDIIRRATNTRERVRCGDSVTPAGLRLKNTFCVRSQMAHDPGKAVYMSCLSKGAFLARFDFATKKLTIAPMPAAYVPPSTEQETYMVFDPKSRRIIHPLVPSMVGVLGQLWIGDPETGTWEMRPAPPRDPRFGPVQGNVLTFDPVCGCAVFYGGHRSDTAPSPTAVWRYRYQKAA